jgi:hypothetical protein
MFTRDMFFVPFILHGIVPSIANMREAVAIAKELQSSNGIVSSWIERSIISIKIRFQGSPAINFKPQRTSLENTSLVLA